MEGNARLTSSTAIALLVMLAVEGVTVLQVHSLLSLHVFVGVLLIPPVLLKIASTGYRFVRYYMADPAYREKGPPAWLLRLLGPAVVILTLVLLGSGVGLMYVGHSQHDLLLTAHKASFVLWFFAMTVHVLGHLPETVRMGLSDWFGRAQRLVGAGRRRSALIASLVVGAAVAWLIVARVGTYLAGFPHFGQ